ncbi:hypothetical protein [Streptomyces africanus]|uniref:hypothetical protein n=1 Tax=Streptomyces africanus TaxID=231024 RepID=UPI000A3CCFDD|nr:hypothetical protein [Streptomyces africanus]
MSQVEEDAAEITRKVWGLMLAQAEGDEDRWDLLIRTTPHELKNGIIRALCVSGTACLEDLVKAVHDVPDPKAYTVALFREQVEQAEATPS